MAIKCFELVLHLLLYTWLLWRKELLAERVIPVLWSRVYVGSLYPSLHFYSIIFVSLYLCILVSLYLTGAHKYIYERQRMEKLKVRNRIYLEFQQNSTRALERDWCLEAKLILYQIMESNDKLCANWWITTDKSLSIK